ncbi:hypothetical protein ACA910_019972 [Epithemia clementina (nom. ined.)]
MRFLTVTVRRTWPPGYIDQHRCWYQCVRTLSDYRGNPRPIPPPSGPQGPHKHANTTPNVFGKSGNGNSPPRGSDGGHPQKFVKVSIQPGEWDEYNFENPLYRPVYQHRSKILSKEDFRNRPKVGFSVHFNSPVDAMMNVTWMTHDQHKEIFQSYKELLKRQHEEFGVTSHEYIMRVIAQNRNIRAERVAGIVQLQHNEERYRLEGMELCEDAAKYMDNSFLTEIREFYKAYRMNPPNDLSLVEDPDEGPMPSKNFRPVDDIFDLDGVWRRFKDEYLPKKAKEIVSKRVYLEDQDDETIVMPMDKETESYLERQKRLTEIVKKYETEHTPKAIRETDEDRPTRRKRFKFVAQLVNTREKKLKIKEAKRKPILSANAAKERRLMSTGYTNNSPENSLVEYDGQIRPATLHDLRHVAWKPIQHDLGKLHTLEEALGVMENTYRDAKRDWLNYINGREHSGVFGADGIIAPTSVLLKSGIAGRGVSSFGQHGAYQAAPQEGVAEDAAEDAVDEDPVEDIEEDVVEDPEDPEK